MNQKDSVAILERYVRARYPIIVINSYEENRVMKAVETVANNRGMDVYEWSFVTGFIHRIKTDGDKKTLIEAETSVDPGQALDQVFTYPVNADAPATIFVMKDLHGILGDKNRPNPKITRFLRDIACRFEVSKHSMILISPEFQIPNELDKTVAVVDFESQDTPLFSGVPMTAVDQQFAPREVVKQPSLFQCEYCHDTGKVYKNAYSNVFVVCFCEKGDELRNDRNPRNSRIGNIAW